MSRKGKSIDSSLVARVANGMRGFWDGVTGNVWFGPGEPIPAQEPDAKRQFDYAVGYNQRTEPRQDEIGFTQLRALANGCDIVRLAIETRKDQMGALSFNIQSKKGVKGNEKQAEDIYNQLQFPDSEHTWSTWLRMLLEELLVIDAPAVNPVWTRGGGVYGLEIIDGSTIKRLLNPQGRTPVPPFPAYQQVIKGLPIVDFTRDELIYKPRNVRVNKVYGFSPVEQIITTINLLLRRETSQLMFYTDGNIPDMFISVTENWNLEQIDAFQKYWDGLMNGEFAAQRGAKFLPGGMKIQEVKERDLKTEFDEWIARIVCFAFSLPPTPFVKQMNRATAEAAQDTALQEGLGPLKQWVKELMDYILAKYFKAPNLEFAWQVDEIEQDPLTKAQIHQIYVNSGIMLVNEVREQIGMQKLTEQEQPAKNQTSKEEKA